MDLPGAEQGRNFSLVHSGARVLALAIERGEGEQLQNEEPLCGRTGRGAPINLNDARLVPPERHCDRECHDELVAPENVEGCRFSAQDDALPEPISRE